MCDVDGETDLAADWSLAQHNAAATARWTDFVERELVAVRAANPDLAPWAIKARSAVRYAAFLEAELDLLPPSPMVTYRYQEALERVRQAHPLGPRRA